MLYEVITHNGFKRVKKFRPGALIGEMSAYTPDRKRTATIVADEDSVRVFADGRIFTGRQAMQLGLVDTLGDLQEALNIAAEMVGMDTPPKTVRA